MDSDSQRHRTTLQRIARRVMLERGLLPDFSAAAQAELDMIQSPAAADGELVRDLRNLLWASIDNDDSLDLDQLTVAEAMPGDRVKIMVAVADVDALVDLDRPIDKHARHNTTSVYTAAAIFPMLPEKLSNHLTSLNFDQDRLSVVIEMVIGADGLLLGSDIYQAHVCNHARLAYNSVAAWLESHGPEPQAVAAVSGLAENLRLQDKAAQGLKDFRHAHGALSLETVQAKPIFEDGRLYAIKAQEKNRARELIEDFMIAVNGVTARYLSAREYPSIRRVVRTPKRWERIVELAQEHGARLPDTPDSKALEAFLLEQKAADPAGFPDLSLAVVKLMGAGEYVAEFPENEAQMGLFGHFGLAVKDYAHSTAPNRRYTDLITQRLLKAAMAGRASPYHPEELAALARHCTLGEDMANKVERQVGKSAAALLLESRIGDAFEAIVTGAASKGTWVRLLDIPVEGRLVQGVEGVDVGHPLRVRLLSVDVEKGYIDFGRVGPSK